jgi:hypothetical protein
MTENSPLVGSRMGADFLRTASAADGDASDLKNAAGERNLGLTDASNLRMSAQTISRPAFDRAASEGERRSQVTHIFNVTAHPDAGSVTCDPPRDRCDEKSLPAAAIKSQTFDLDQSLKPIRGELKFL